MTLVSVDVNDFMFSLLSDSDMELYCDLHCDPAFQNDMIISATMHASDPRAFVEALRNIADKMDAHLDGDDVREPSTSSDGEARNV